MRCDQWIGLKPEAKEFIQGMYKVQYDTKDQCWSGEMPLYRYGNDLFSYIEVVQEIVWSSGPCYFTCLEREQDNSRMFEWTDSEIEDNI